MAGRAVNLRDLEYFASVAEQEHFGKAAEHCHVSQPTLSGQIKKLEESLGVKLLERTNRRVMMTEPGREVLASVRRILAEVERIRDVARAAQDPLAGRFRLGAFPTLSSYVLPDLVRAVRRELPRLRLVLSEEKTESLLARLRDGSLDAALIALPVRDDFLVAEPLFRDEFLLAVPEDHPLAGRREVALDDLGERNLLLLEEGHCLRDQALEVCSRHGIGEEQDFRATSLETLREMVRAGTGITLVPRIAVREGESGIRYLTLRAPVPSREIGLVWRKTTARREVLDRLVRCLRRSGAETGSRSPTARPGRRPTAHRRG